MVVTMIEGGPGSGKGLFLASALRKARLGQDNSMLRDSRGYPKHYRTAYKMIANFGTYFCHPPVEEVDFTGLVTYLPSCSCPAAQPGGTLDPMDLVERAWQKREFEPYTVLGGHEWQRWSEARITTMLPKKSKVQRILMSYLYDETRKSHFDFLLDTQSRDKVDNRLRESGGWLVVCENLARDPENEPAYEHYTIFGNPFGFTPWKFEYYPGTDWSRFYMTKYNTWETPKYRSEAEIALEEYEKEIEFYREKMRERRQLDKVHPINDKETWPEVEDFNVSRVKKQMERLRRTSHEVDN